MLPTWNSCVRTSLAGLAAVLSAAVLGGSPASAGTLANAAVVRLQRDVPQALATSKDLGRLADGLVLPHVRLALTRPAPLQAELDRLTRDQHVRGSADFHRWLTPLQLRRYGPAQADVERVTAWLAQRGLTVNAVSPSGMTIDFGGPSGRVAAAFRTELHNVVRDGEAHVSNVTAPAIPASLASVVTGVALSNFYPKPAMRHVTPNLTVNVQGSNFYAVSPSDFATIYNVNPLRSSANFFGQPITGAGITIAMVEQTTIQAQDWLRFRSAFKLNGYAGKLVQIHPGGCINPGRQLDESEAALDSEWSSAVAPDATIIEASCAGTAPFGFGVMTALENLVEAGTNATVLSISYGGDERALGFAFEQMWTNLLQEGAAEGKAIFVSTGDGATSAQTGRLDRLGLYVNGLADSAYNVAVGGTDFYDTALNQNAKYWSQKNSASLGSALSYIPEIVWNNSCSNSVIWKFNRGLGPLAFCNSNFQGPLQNDVGGSGSQSVFYTKPDWQLTSVLGVPNDGVRDQPDVSLFAANGIWSHFYVYCMSDATEGGAPCDYTPNGIFNNAAGGTSFAAPAFAGIAALIQETQPNAAPLGNPAPVFYKIAQAQFSTPLGLSKCDSTLGNAISSSCVFNYVTVGDNSAPCVSGSANCYSNAASTQGIGVLATTVAGKRVFAYPAQPGYSLATGLGTVNVENLIYNYATGL